MQALGIDISRWQGDFDFAKLGDDYKRFIMIKAGSGQSKVDSQYPANLKKAKDKGIPFGVYWYSYATTVEGAKTEIESFKKAIEQAKTIGGSYFMLPPFLDMEDADGYKKSHGNPTNEVLTAISNQYITSIPGCGVYASLGWFNNQLKEIKDCKHWVARWGDNDTQLEADEVVKGCFMQQFTSNLDLAGTRVDLNILNDTSMLTIGTESKVIDKVIIPVTKTTKAIIYGSGQWVAQLQTILNRDYKAGLTVDKLAGPKTLKACPVISYEPYKTKPIVLLIQLRLRSVGFTIKVDGVFGGNTLAAVKEFQRNRGLKPDGVIGPKTWPYLLSGVRY